MRLQEARANAKPLGQPHINKQAINQALKQFEANHSDACKEEKKWNKKNEERRLWDDKKVWEKFKLCWKEDIHQWETVSGKQQAHQALDLQGMIDDVSALQAEICSLHKENKMLTQQLGFQQALNAHNCGVTTIVVVMMTALAPSLTHLLVQ